MIDVQNFATQRLDEELKNMNMNPPTHCSYGPVNNDIFQWQGIIMGPANSPYEGGVFHLSIGIPLEYPFKPPKIKFQTKIYHPYIDKDGTILMDILEERWSPALSIETLLLSICSFLADPQVQYDPDSISDSFSNLYLDERVSGNKIAKEWTKKYAMC